MNSSAWFGTAAAFSQWCTYWYRYMYVGGMGCGKLRIFVGLFVFVCMHVDAVHVRVRTPNDHDCTDRLTIDRCLASVGCRYHPTIDDYEACLCFETILLLALLDKPTRGQENG